MKVAVMFVLLVGLLGMMSSEEPKISVTPALVATGYNTSEAFVIGKDMKTRHCPSDFNLYIRIDGKKPEDKNLYYVAPKQMLTPQQGGVSFTAFCIREDVH